MRAVSVGTLLLLIHALIPKAFAHAIVTGSSLDQTPIVANSRAKVVLNFNTKVEPSLSKFLLVSAGDVRRSLTFHPDNKSGRIVLHLKPLPAGAYAIHYKVFAADGHLSESFIHFEIIGK